MYSGNECWKYKFAQLASVVGLRRGLLQDSKETVVFRSSKFLCFVGLSAEISQKHKLILSRVNSLSQRHSSSCQLTQLQERMIDNCRRSQAKPLLTMQVIWTSYKTNIASTLCASEPPSGLLQGTTFRCYQVSAAAEMGRRHYSLLLVPWAIWSPRVSLSSSLTFSFRL